MEKRVGKPVSVDECSAVKRPARNVRGTDTLSCVDAEVCVVERSIVRL